MTGTLLRSDIFFMKLVDHLYTVDEARSACSLRAAESGDNRLQHAGNGLSQIASRRLERVNGPIRQNVVKPESIKG